MQMSVSVALVAFAVLLQWFSVSCVCSMASLDSRQFPDLLWTHSEQQEGAWARALAPDPLPLWARPRLDGLQPELGTLLLSSYLANEIPKLKQSLLRVPRMTRS